MCAAGRICYALLELGGLFQDDSIATFIIREQWNQCGQCQKWHSRHAWRVQQRIPVLGETPTRTPMRSSHTPVIQPVYTYGSNSLQGWYMFEASYRGRIQKSTLWCFQREHIVVIFKIIADPMQIANFTLHLSPGTDNHLEHMATSYP